MRLARPVSRDGSGVASAACDGVERLDRHDLVGRAGFGRNWRRPRPRRRSRARRTSPAALVALWSARLALHIARAPGAPDDPRYADLARDGACDASRRMFWFPPVTGDGWLCPRGRRASGRRQVRRPSPPGRYALAVAILLVAVAGEALADAQLQRFRRAHRGEKLICENGCGAGRVIPIISSNGWAGSPIRSLAISGENPWGWLWGAPC